MRIRIARIVIKLAVKLLYGFDFGLCQVRQFKWLFVNWFLLKILLIDETSASGPIDYRKHYFFRHTVIILIYIINFYEFPVIFCVH